MTKIIGKVVEAGTGEALPFVNIFIPKSSSNLEVKTVSGVGQVGTTSDDDGDFEITMPENEFILAFTMIGYKPKLVNTTRNRTGEIKVEMQPDDELEEVVITAPRVAPKKNNNTLYYILGGLVVLAILVYFLRKNNGNKPIIDLV